MSIGPVYEDGKLVGMSVWDGRSPLFVEPEEQVQQPVLRAHAPRVRRRASGTRPQFKTPCMVCGREARFRLVKGKCEECRR